MKVRISRNCPGFVVRGEALAKAIRLSTGRLAAGAEGKDWGGSGEGWHWSRPLWMEEPEPQLRWGGGCWVWGQEKTGKEGGDYRRIVGALITELRYSGLGRILRSPSPR